MKKKLWILAVLAALSGLPGCATRVYVCGDYNQVETSCAKDFAKGDPAVSVGGLTTPGLTIDKRQNPENTAAVED